MQAKRTPTGVRVSGFDGLPGWTVETADATGAITIVPPPGVDVTVTAIRDLPLGAALRAARGLRAGDALESLVSMAAAGPEDDKGKPAKGNPLDRLQRVGVVYRLALANGLEPLSAIAHAFEVSDRTARRLIVQARAEGILGPYADEKRRHGWPKEARRYIEQRDAARQRGETPKPYTQADREQLLDLLRSDEYRQRTGRVHSPALTTNTDERKTK